METVEYHRDCCISAINMLLCDSKEEYATLAAAISSSGTKADYEANARNYYQRRLY